MRRASIGLICSVAMTTMVALAATLAGAESNHGDEANFASNQAELGEVEGGTAKDFVSPLVIPGAEWRCDGVDPGGYFFLFSNGGPGPVSGAAPCMMAPVFISGGVTITEFWVSMLDNHATYDLNVSLNAIDNYSGTRTVLTSVITTGQSATIQSLGSTGLNINTDDSSSYYLTTCFSGGTYSELRVLNTRIWFTE